jgi:hypothetical protein
MVVEMIRRGRLVRQSLSSAEAKSLKTKGQGTDWLPVSETVVEAARQGPVGRIKGLLSRHVYSKRESCEAALCLTEKGQKAAHQRKSTKKKKERLLTLDSGCWCRREGWSRWRWRWVRTSHADHKSMWQCFGVLRVKRQKVGVNRWLKAHNAGGGLVLTQHLIMW